jgi:hypothetical protein
MTSTPSLAVVWARGFTPRLMPPRPASPHTLSASRDPVRRLLRVTQPRRRKPPARLALSDRDAPRIVACLAEMEQRRGRAPRSRTLRLTALRALLQYAACEAPAQSAQIPRVLAIPGTREPARAGALRDTAGRGRMARSPRPADGVWPPRSCVRRDGCANRRARVRTDRAAPAGCAPGHRRASPRGGPGTQGTRHAAAPADGGRRARLAARARARRSPHTMSQRPWGTPQGRRGAIHRGTADRGSRSDVPVSPADAGDAAGPASYDGPGALTRWGGSSRQRTVARAGIGRHDADLPAGEPRVAGRNLGQDHTTRWPAWTVSAR